jgi:hypothetical protein
MEGDATPCPGGMPQLRSATGRTVTILLCTLNGDASTQLLEVGLIDSKDLLDIILEVEERCAVEFDAEHIDFELGLTLGSLISAFA